MTKGKTVSLIGLSTLENIGLKSLLRDAGAPHVETFGSFAESSPLADKSDAFVVRADTFAANLDFFMPRRQKTLIVSESAGQDDGSCRPFIINPRDDESRAEAVIGRFVECLADNPEEHGELSAREREVLRLIAQGKINKEIADILCISINTVITHRKNISAKLNIKSAQGLSLYAMMNGLI